MRAGWTLLVALLTAGCASQLSYDLGKAEHVCHAETWTTKTALDACLAEHERPVWAKDEPQTLDLYEGFAAAREQLAREFDQHALSQDQYADRLDRLTQDFHARIIARCKAAATQ